MYAIDFFCGAGGLTKGLCDAKIKVLFGIDNDITSKETYEKNNNVLFINEDLAELSNENLEKLINKVRKIFGSIQN